MRLGASVLHCGLRGDSGTLLMEQFGDGKTDARGAADYQHRMVCSNVSMATFLLQQRRGVRVIENQHLRQRT